MPLQPSLIWLNGAFGVGKSTTAEALQRVCPDHRIFDPESVGAMLKTQLRDQSVDDFQDWPAWRSIAVASADALIRQTDQSLIAPQTVTSSIYWSELKRGMAERGMTIFHVVLDANREALTERIRASAESTGWRLAQVDRFLSARDAWLTGAADLVVDVSTASATEAAAIICRAMGTVQAEPSAERR